MFFDTIGIRATGAALALLAVTACSASRMDGASAIPSIATSSAAAASARRSPDAKVQPVIYTMTGGHIAMYKAHIKNPKAACTVPAPSSSAFISEDIAVDKKGDLWAPVNAHSSAPSQLVEWAPQCGRVLQTIDDAAGTAAGFAFGSDGTMYVANTQNGSGQAGNIAIFAPGASTPSSTLTNSLLYYVTSVAVNANGDVFALGYDASFAQHLVEFASGSTSGTPVTLSGITLATGLTFDRKQNLIVTDDGANQDEIYAAPYSGAPTATIALQPSTQAYYSELNKSNERLFVSASNGIEVFTYPKGTYLHTIKQNISHTTGAGGLAVAPPSAP